MKIYLEDKKTIIENPDLTKGRIIDDTREITIEEIPFIKEEGHYITIKEYDNGGKDIEWVVDKPAQSYVPSRVEEEEIKVYKIYSKEELIEVAKGKIRKEILKYKKLLIETDFYTMKFLEGALEEEEFNKRKIERAGYRLRINQLESEIINLK